MKAHRTDGVSLTFALIFLTIAAWWLIAQLFDLSLPAVGWILAGGLILIGVMGLLGALRSGRSTTVATAAGSPAPESGPVPMGPTTSDPATAEFTTTEFSTTEFTRIDPGIDPVPSRPKPNADAPRPDDHQD
jgi:hypothetical protein